MDCTITLPAITKFSHTALSLLISTFLSVAPDDVGISASWPEPVNGVLASLPTKVIAHVPDGSNCGLINARVAQNFNPTKSDEEEAQEQSAQDLDSRINQTQTIQDILGRLDALEGN